MDSIDISDTAATRPPLGLAPPTRPSFRTAYAAALSPCVSRKSTPVDRARLRNARKCRRERRVRARGANFASFGQRQRRGLEHACPTARTRGAGGDLRARCRSRLPRTGVLGKSHPTRRDAICASQQPPRGSRQSGRARAARDLTCAHVQRASRALGRPSPTRRRRGTRFARIVLGGGNARPWADSGSQRAFKAFGARAEAGRERRGGAVGVWVKRRRRGGRTRRFAAGRRAHGREFEGSGGGGGGGDSSTRAAVCGRGDERNTVG
ncbi:hypothetical protein B0H15DRAFT_153191 [Mycena belliarum]|uniref:Uncharacterized protein n=1 Tax=Mycena belliarum TaxID=1033014 RepID=A0AAD6TNK4_9AGAR|nr:hypothetical protein B0H15DRAFT_153191 [Mycena belliae]